MYYCKTQFYITHFILSFIFYDNKPNQPPIVDANNNILIGNLPHNDHLDFTNVPIINANDNIVVGIPPPNR